MAMSIKSPRVERLAAEVAALAGESKTEAIRAVRTMWTGTFMGQEYSVPNLRFHECPRCGERVYAPSAMRRIEAASPAYIKSRRARRTA